MPTARAGQGPNVRTETGSEDEDGIDEADDYDGVA